MSVYKTSTGESWSYSFQRKGRKVQRAGFRTRAEALSAQEKRKDELRKTSLIHSTFLDACNDYLRYLETEGRTPKYTKDVRWRIVSQFEKWYPRMLRTITKQEIQKHIDNRFLSWTPRTANADLSLLRSIFAVQVANQNLIYNPTLGIPKKRGERTKKKSIPSLADFQKVLMASQGRLRLLLEILYETAGRKEEVLNLRKQDVNFQDNCVTLCHSKSGGRGVISRTVPLTPKFAQKMKRLDDGYLFGSSKTGKPQMDWRKQLGKAIDKAQVKPFSLGTIRPLRASMLKLEGWPVVAVQLFLGHAHISTTERYIHSEMALEMLRSLVEGK